MSLENTPLSSGQSTPTPPKAPKRPYWTRNLIKRQRDQIRENLCKRFAAAVDDNARDGFENALVIETNTDEGSKKIREESKTVQQSSQKDNNGPMCQLDIGGDHYVVAKNFRDNILVHIRVYKRDQNNKLYPTKQGIALDLEKWVKVQESYAEDVDAAILDYIGGREVDFSAHLGENYYITLKTGYSLVHIRKWFLPADEENIKPTKKGWR